MLKMEILRKQNFRGKPNQNKQDTESRNFRSLKHVFSKNIYTHTRATTSIHPTGTHLSTIVSLKEEHTDINGLLI